MTAPGARPVRATDLAVLLAGVVGMAAGITLMFLAMRDVLAIGGSCAEGGPYVIARPCPTGTVPSMLVGTFGGLASTGLVAWKGSTIGGSLASAAGLGWPALFGSLGWNFLEFGLGLHALPDGTRLEGDAGLVICGVVFEAMALPVALGFAGSLLASLGEPGRRAPAAPPSRIPVAGLATARRLRPAPVDPARAAGLAELDAALRAGLAARVAGTTMDAGARKDEAGGAAAATAQVQTLVEGLERLAALHDAGRITDIEFAAAKARLLAAADQ